MFLNSTVWAQIFIPFFGFLVIFHIEAKKIDFFFNSHKNWFSFVVESYKIYLCILLHTKVHHDSGCKWLYKDPIFTHSLWFTVGNLLKKWTLETLESHFGVSVLNHSSNNTVFCLHGLCKVSKSRVSGGLPVIGLSKIQSFNSKIAITLFLNDRRDEFSICLFFFPKHFPTRLTLNITEHCL